MKLKIKKLGVKKAYLNDVFYWVLRTSWPKFIGFAIMVYMSVNSFFASLYFLLDAEILNTDKGSFWDAFVFSFHISFHISFLPLTPPQMP